MTLSGVNIQTFLVIRNHLTSLGLMGSLKTGQSLSILDALSQGIRTWSPTRQAGRDPNHYIMTENSFVAYHITPGED